MGRLLLILKNLRRNIRRILSPQRVEVVRMNGNRIGLFYRHDNHNSLLFLLFFTLISNGSCLVSGRDSIRTTPTPRSVCLSRLLVP